ncbi:CSLREA domain-containing protein [Modestobacter caceresii]|uniref:CSLREA domain-containing protein n=1 Tax=Modestobacter caceresii TaxID=1522368 RepID=UPI0006923F06|nr:CSLREA domain-containing protein [Modestobacter caceresii]
MRTRSLAGAAASALAISLLAGSPALAHDAWAAGEGQESARDQSDRHQGNRGDDDRYHGKQKDRDRQQGIRVTTTADTVDAGPGDGRCADVHEECSLRAAVQEANASGGGTIELSKGTYLLTLRNGDAAGEDDSATGDLDIRAEITIKGNGGTVDAQGIDRGFDVLVGGWLSVRDLTVTGGVAAGTGLPASGGGLRNAGTLEVQRSAITGNSAVRAGGGIEASDGSTTTVSWSRLSGNSTGDGPGNGGGLHLTGAGTVDVERSAVTGNTAASEGGGLWNSGLGTMTVDRSIVVGNTASGAEATMGGGGLFQEAGESGTLVVTRSAIKDNVADGASGSGGGILNDQGTLLVDRSLISGNSATRAGGGIEANVGTTTLERSLLTGNSTGDSPGNGGGLHLTGAGTVDIDRSRVTSNTAAAEGGGLWNSATGTMTVTRTAVRGNSAPVGPNVFQDGPGSGLTVDGETVPATP